MPLVSEMSLSYISLICHTTKPFYLHVNESITSLVGTGAISSFACPVLDQLVVLFYSRINSLLLSCRFNIFVSSKILVMIILCYDNCLHLELSFVNKHVSAMC